MKIKPISFSKHFKVDKKRLSELGIFNPILNFDTKLFVEPLLLKQSASPIIQRAFETYNEFFRVLLVLIKASKEPNDKPWREAKRRINFPEYKATCIGYGSDSINGSGSGRELNERILQSAKEMVNASRDAPEIFQLLPLLEEGIGADIISDMTQTIIDDDICQYTVDAMEKLGIKGTFRYTTRKNITYMLPWNPYHKCPVKLLPVDILSNLPLADHFDDWVVNATMNSKLRDEVNAHIGSVWLDANKASKKETILQLIKNEKDFFFTVLRALQDSHLEHYDIEQDYQGLRRWLEDSKKFISSHTSDTIKTVEIKQEVLFKAVEDIIKQFKDVIENQDLWRIFWTDFRAELKHVNELYSQMLFYMVSSSWLAALDSNISVEKHFNLETKQMNFIFSVSKKCSVTVQVKHSDNFSGLEKAYDKQHSLYNEGKVKESFYVVINFSTIESEQLASIKQKERSDYAHCKVIEIYANAEDLRSRGDLDGVLVGFEGLEHEDNRYIQEKRKGGRNSYQAYQPLKSKVEEICKEEMANKAYTSARQLCLAVSVRIEKQHLSLLNEFNPYRQFKKEGIDWTNPTFYNWCNEIYKVHRILPVDA